LCKLATLDWSRNNVGHWEGRAMNAGRLSKRNVNVVLTANLIKMHLGLKLSADEQEVEQEFRRNRDARRNK
jgi:DNA sulfur modification protein DndB